MAKSTDDTNDSQFFITEGPQRFLDFNHSVFGQLVEGFDVLEAVTSVPTDVGDRPLIDVVMRSVDVLTDAENGMLMLKAPEGISGEATIRVTVTNEEGTTFQRTFHVTVQPDPVNGGPFLEDIPDLQTTTGQPISFQLVARDADGDAVYFDAQRLGTVDYALAIDSTTGVVEVTPPSGFVGTMEVLVRVRPATSSDTNDLYDSQRVTIRVTP